MTEDDLQVRADSYHQRVYAMGGGVTTSEDDGETLYAAVSLPGFITKFETLDRAIERLNDYTKNQREPDRVR